MGPSRNKNVNNGSSCSSPSKPSSTCSSPSSSGTLNKRSMEDVWQDLSSLQDHINTSATPNTTTNTIIPNNTSGLILFQDFFASPFNKDLPPPPPTTTNSSLSNNSCFDHLAPHQGSLLSLNSGSGFHFLENITALDQRPSQQLLHGFPLNNDSPLDNASLSPSSQVVPSICLQRNQENGDHSNDRRHKRMIKNRESAARSRARKQAYTIELEQEVARLEKENTNLRRQQQQLLASPGLPKKQTLNRTLTAPF